MRVLPKERINQRRFSIINIICQSSLILIIMITAITLFITKTITLTPFLIFFLGSPVTISLTMAFFSMMR
jgi:hypothetical protein